MSGSSAKVLLRTPLSSERLAQLEAFVLSVSGSSDWRSFWLLGQPFTINLEEPDEEELRFQQAGWVPTQAIALICQCRGRAGDLLLAFVAGRLAEMFSGLIAVGIRLEDHTSNPAMLTFDGRYGSGELGDVLTPDCLSYWAGDPEFRMDN